jgi:hypothetical protein
VRQHSAGYGYGGDAYGHYGYISYDADVGEPSKSGRGKTRTHLLPKTDSDPIPTTAG